MPTQEAVMGQIISEVRSGAGGKALGDTAAAKLRELYWSWIEQKQIADIWDQDAGRGLRGRFRQIGQRAAAGADADEIDSATVESASLAVESESDCPLCPPRP